SVPRCSPPRPATLCPYTTLFRSGSVTVARLAGVERFPAAFQLVASANPCPCGRPGGRCRCSDRQVARNRQALSGPLLDRIDLQETGRAHVRTPVTCKSRKPTSA